MQNGFSGIGNWMADEILWRAKIHPATRAGELTAPKRAALFRETKFVVRESLRTVGKDFSDPPRNWLIHQKWKREWNLSAPSHTIKARNDRRSHHRLVPALSALSIRRCYAVM